MNNLQTHRRDLETARRASAVARTNGARIRAVCDELLLKSHEARLASRELTKRR